MEDPTDEQNLRSWLEDKNLEMRDALDAGDTEAISLLGPLIAKGADHMRSMSRYENSDEEFRSRSAPGGAVCTLLREVRTPRCIARYGHRGTRVGEAAHPGPTTEMLDYIQEDSLLPGSRRRVRRRIRDSDSDALVRDGESPGSSAPNSAPQCGQSQSSKAESPSQ